MQRTSFAFVHRYKPLQFQLNKHVRLKFEASRATQKGVGDHIWPAGHQFWHMCSTSLLSGSFSNRYWI